MKSGKNKTRLICLILTMLLSVCVLSACGANTTKEDKALSNPSAEESAQTNLDIEDSDRKTENNDKNGASKEAYQGIFMNGDIFIGLPLYTGGFDDDPVGVAYRNTKPEWGDDGLIESDVIETLGEIYDLGSGEYEIRGKGTTYDLTYYDGKVVLTGDSEYAGTYVQISNSGADMDPSEVWLDIPE